MIPTYWACAGISTFLHFAYFYFVHCFIMILESGIISAVLSVEFSYATVTNSEKETAADCECTYMMKKQVRRSVFKQRYSCSSHKLTIQNFSDITGLYSVALKFMTAELEYHLTLPKAADLSTVIYIV